MKKNNKKTDKNEKKIQKESEHFIFIGRAKLNILPDEPDTFFAKEIRTGKIKLIRGPLIEEECIEDLKLIHILKNNLNLNIINFVVVSLLPDLIEGILSSRNYLNKNKSYPFIIYDIELREDENNKICKKIILDEIWGKISLINLEYLHDYKLWNISKLFSSDNNKIIDIKELICLFLFRKIIGYKNISEIDFLTDQENNLFILNEYKINKNFSIFEELGPCKSKILKKILLQNYDYFNCTIEKWKLIINQLIIDSKNSKENERLKIILDNLCNINLQNF